MKLTIPQRKVLEELMYGARHYWFRYMPVVKLVDLGLVAIGNPGVPHMGNPLYTITSAGRKWLREHE